jgi:hypothetical protein
MVRETVRKQLERTTSGAPASSGRSRTLTRNPFPEEHFFSVPLALLDRGIAQEMTSSSLKRYVTLLRLSNFSYGNGCFRISLEDLEKLDGLSARRTHEISPKLEERGLIRVDRTTKPYTYTLVAPSGWAAPAPAKHFLSLTPRGVLRVEAKFPDVPWEKESGKAEYD